MAAFEPNLTPVIKKAARLMETRLKYQAPYRTGKLKKSIRVQGFENKDGIQFVADYVQYGVYLDNGTGPYRQTRTDGEEWNPRPGKGKGGIKPRFWTNTDQKTKDVMAKMINAEIAKQFKQAIRNISRK